MDFSDWPWLLPVVGVAAGAVLGFVARRRPRILMIKALEGES